MSVLAAPSHHKAVQLTEMEERLRHVEEELGLLPGPWMSHGVSASEP
jgi:hypothetical protein